MWIDKYYDVSKVEFLWITNEKDYTKTLSDIIITHNEEFVFELQKLNNGLYNILTDFNKKLIEISKKNIDDFYSNNKIVNFANEDIKIDFLELQKMLDEIISNKDKFDESFFYFEEYLNILQKIGTHFKYLKEFWTNELWFFNWAILELLKTERFKITENTSKLVKETIKKIWEIF